MSNSFGSLLKLTTFGESHGSAIGGVLDGMPPGIPINYIEIENWVTQRKGGTSKYVTPRSEKDNFKLLSGLTLVPKVKGLKQYKISQDNASPSKQGPNDNNQSCSDSNTAQGTDCGAYSHNTENHNNKEDDCNDFSNNRGRGSSALYTDDLDSSGYKNINSSNNMHYEPVYDGTMYENPKDIDTDKWQWVTTGAPIGIYIENSNIQSKDYRNIKNNFRPSHGDLTYYNKYHGLNDYRGGGRSSARETLVRTIAGAIAINIIPGISINGEITNIGGKINNSKPNQEPSYQNLWCSNFNEEQIWRQSIESAIEEGDSLGASVTITINNPPRNLGEPIFNKVSAALGYGILSIPAVKSFAIGEGINSANMKGSQFNDNMQFNNHKINFLSNNSGGSLGGISTGEPIVIHYNIKPTSSISKEQSTLNKQNENSTISVKGRHDPCVGLRSVIVAKAMCALTLADLYLINKRF